MKRLTIPAIMALAVMATPFWTVTSAAEDAHHPAQAAQAQPTPAVPSAQAQAPAPQAPGTPSGQEPATGQMPQAPGQARVGPMQGGMMMNCPMMQGMMHGHMMQMMQGMMQMMQTMQAQMQMMHGQMQMMQGQTQPRQTSPGQMQPGQM